MVSAGQSFYWLYPAWALSARISKNKSNLVKYCRVCPQQKTDVSVYAHDC